MPNVILIINCFAITINQMHMCLDRLSFHFNSNAYHGQLPPVGFVLFSCVTIQNPATLLIFAILCRIHNSIEPNALRILLEIQHNPNTTILFEWAALCNWEVIFIYLFVYVAFSFAWYFVYSSNTKSNCFAIHDLLEKFAFNISLLLLFWRSIVCVAANRMTFSIAVESIEINFSYMSYAYRCD